MRWRALCSDAAARVRRAGVACGRGGGARLLAAGRGLAASGAAPHAGRAAGHHLRAGPAAGRGARHGLPGACCGYLCALACQVVWGGRAVVACPIGCASGTSACGQVAEAGAVRMLCSCVAARAQECLEDSSQAVVALGLSALARLCDTDLLDFYKAWRVSGAVGRASFHHHHHKPFAEGTWLARQHCLEGSLAVLCASGATSERADLLTHCAGGGADATQAAVAPAGRRRLGLLLRHWPPGRRGVS